jgi:hypothetical protein
MIQLIKEKIGRLTQAISDLPIQMEGTDYLIHPVGDLRVQVQRQDMVPV